MSEAKEKYLYHKGEYGIDSRIDNYVKELEKQLEGFKSEYNMNHIRIEKLESFIMSNSNDMAAFIVANNIKSKRVNARESQ